MLREDNLVIGFAIGVVLPVLAYLAVDSGIGLLADLGVTGEYGQPIAFRPRTTALVAVCVNLIPFKLYADLRNEASMRGVFAATGVYALMWIYVYGRQIFGA